MLGIDGEGNVLKVDEKDKKRLADLKTSHFPFCFSDSLPDTHINIPDTVSKGEYLISIRELSGIINT